jgi:flagellar FliJ protein
MSGSMRDRGMRAVARVRGVREQDSRIGLQQALTEQREHEARAVELRGRIETGDSFALGTAASFLALRASLDALGQVLRAAEAEAASSRTVSEAAYAHWLADRTRLSAVETLLDRRERARREEAARREARELDDIAAQLWLRRDSAGEDGG